MESKEQDVLDLEEIELSRRRAQQHARHRSSSTIDFTAALSASTLANDDREAYEALLLRTSQTSPQQQEGEAAIEHIDAEKAAKEFAILLDKWRTHGKLNRVLLNFQSLNFPFWFHRGPEAVFG
jgi:hypothetical protein